MRMRIPSIGKGPQIYEGFPIDMGMGSPYLYSFGDPGSPKSGVPVFI